MGRPTSIARQYHASDPRRGRAYGLRFALAAVVCAAWIAALPATRAAGPTARDAADGVSIIAAADDAPLPRGRIDELIAAAAAEGIEPAPTVDDHAYLRRVTIDLVGRIPTAAECRLFAREPAADRRRRLVRRLVASDRFADRWAVWLGDMIRVRTGAPGGQQLDQFLRRSMRERVPYDQVARHLLTAVGSPSHDGAAGFFVAEAADPLEMAGVVAQTLLGMRMKCARCHDHPFDRWSQKEYYQLAAFFGETRSSAAGPNRPVRLVESGGQRVRWPPPDGPHAGDSPEPINAHWPLPRAADDDAGLAAALDRRRLVGVRKPDEGVEDLLDGDDGAPASRDGVVLEAAVAAPPTDAQAGRLRRMLADHVTDPRNRGFARNLVNRLWATLVGRGLVEPVDDVRDDNPPRHPELLDHLADELVASGHDIRHVVMLIVASDAYSRSHADAADPAARARLEDACLAAPLRPMPAESLHDSVITAGHLYAFKHPPNANLRSIEERVLVRREPAPDGGPAGGNAAVAEVLLGGRLAVADADDESGSEDITMAMMEADPLAGMRVLDPKRDRAPAAKASRPPSAEEIARLYRVETVTRQIDVNPRFEWAVGMPLPAPPQHFLRLLGQSARQDVDDQGKPRPHMRQALVLLNGPLVHEAARVGSLEPLGRAIEIGGRPDLVGMLYTETLSRLPTAAERDVADEVIAAAGSTADGVADMRWAILNSREFRFIP